MIEISREQGESLLIGDRIAVEVMDIDDDEVLLSIEGVEEDEFDWLADEAVEHRAIGAID